MRDGFLDQRWRDAHAELGIAAEFSTLDRLVAFWGADGRFYHSLSHLRHGLAALADHWPKATLVHLAWFFHDAVYEVGRSDNEVESARWFAAYAEEQGLDAERLRRGADLILLTKDHQGAVTDDPLWPIMNDVDLGVFAASRAVYEAYAEDVWREYQAVATRKQFILGRAAFMSAFKSRPIFLTDGFRPKEGIARANIDVEIGRLMEEARREGWLQH